MKMAGVAIFVGVAQFAFFLMIAEAYYPGYSISQNYISDLGATCNVTCRFIQPTSMIFNSSIIILGIVVLIASYLLRRGFGAVLLPALLAISGLGMIGVGIFTEAAGVLHVIFSFLTFLFIGMTAIAAYRFQKRPMSYFSVLVGIVTLLALFMFSNGIYLGLGPGGMERVIVYPVMLWAIGFGGHLIAWERHEAVPRVQ